MDLEHFPLIILSLIKFLQLIIDLQILHIPELFDYEDYTTISDETLDFDSKIYSTDLG